MAREFLKKKRFFWNALQLFTTVYRLNNYGKKKPQIGNAY
jgi:hypothetical protein